MDQQDLENMWRTMKEHNLDVNSEFKCTICKMLLINACNAPCGCRFCLECIKEYLHGGRKKCPGQSQFCGFDQIDIDTDIQINRLINIRISKLSVKCPNIDCQSQVELSMIADHLRVCENQPQTCPYVSLGCGENKFENIQVKDHLLMDIDSHSSLLINWIKSSQDEMKSLRSDMEKTREDNEERTKTSQFETKMKILNQEMAQLRTQMENLNNEMESRKLHDELSEEECHEIHNQTEESHDQIKVDDIAQADVATQTEQTETENSMYCLKTIINNAINGEFIWRIDNLTEKMRNAETFGDPFLTHQNGYTIRLAAKSRCNGLYIGFCILSGPFDPMLPWPFEHNVESSLINQETGGVHQTVSCNCSSYSTSGSLQKPKDGSQNNSFSINCFPLPMSPAVLQHDRIFITFSMKNKI